MGTSAKHIGTAPLIVRAVKHMAPTARVVIGKSDHYDPGSRTIHLTPETLSVNDRFSMFRACHEAGHALQHSRNTRLWRLRTQWLPVLSDLWGLLVTLSIPCAFIHFWLCAGLSLAAIAVILFRAWIIVGTEREATNIALEWLDETFAIEDAELAAGRKHLAGLRQTYWRALIGK